MSDEIPALMVHHYDQYAPVYQGLIDMAITTWREHQTEGLSAVEIHNSIHTAFHQDDVSWEQLANFAQFCIERLANQR